MNLKLLYNSFIIHCALNIERAGSSALEKGGKPQQHNMTDSLSFIINLFKLPLVLYIPRCKVRTIFCIFSFPSLSSSLSPIGIFILIIVNNLISLHQFSISISR